MDGNTDEYAVAIAVYMLGFGTYQGFNYLLRETDIEGNDTLKHIYEYSKMFSKE